MHKTLFSILAGTTGFVGTVAESTANIATEAVQHVQPALQDPNTYLKGAIVSAVLQIALKLIDKWGERRKEKRAAKEAAKAN
ncbi:transcriptional regulator [Pseudopedobacter saltans DSM 12145]|uniref:Transcriptional regulator n=1 Tax=Pseudopedobacter saltans (strain ATCC 51119 / DSM 12145 / JCM 21818 / CCUG 39354 / LMG 10337 / NBRC 100064 / NCIMB 13643) TaxID=762903 RepID=F0S9T0_PSESL|nr:hypothetical protein [Pseudopedobacter saltans]ADY51436.1 transcriptional regulator [Pseudopedobacter saltans DSM 12145]